MLLSPAAFAGEGTRDNIENVDKWRLGVDFQIKLAKGLKLDIEPELRFYDGFDCFNLSGSLSYRTFGCIYWGATYRLVCDRKFAGVVETTFSSRTEYDWENYHRYAFDLSYKDDFGRFTPSFRVRYNNFTDSDNSDKEYLRYRVKLEYNIRKCDFTPAIYSEFFQQLNSGLGYKMRYAADMEYKVSKHSSFSISYKFDFFMLEYTNAHIFSFGYKCKL